MEETCKDWLRRESRKGVTRELPGAIGLMLVAVPVFMVKYAFVLGTIYYFYTMARVRAGHLPPDDAVNRGFAVLQHSEGWGVGPDVWALLVVALLCCVYFVFFGRPREGRLTFFSEVGSGRLVLSVPHEAGDGERTLLHRATPGAGTMLFRAIFALPILLEDSWRRLRFANRLRKLGYGACAPVVAFISDRGHDVKLSVLEEHFGPGTLCPVLRQLWLVPGVGFHADDPQRITLGKLARDELLILSVA